MPSPTIDLFNSLIGDDSTSSPSTVLVPNEHIRIPCKYKLAIIGKCPDKHDLEVRRPMIGGANSAILWPMLANLGIRREYCFIGHISQEFVQFKDPVNEHTVNRLEEYLDILRGELEAFKPNMILLLGSDPLHFALNSDCNVSNWRGSLFRSTQLTFMGFKCMATHSPLNVIRCYNDYIQLFRFDLRRAVQQSLTPLLEVRERNLESEPNLGFILAQLDLILERKSKISVDIETTGGGTKGHMTCLSIATSSTFAFIIPFSKLGVGGSYWSLDEEMEIWLRLRRIFLDPTIPKILQNSLYDNFYLSYKHRCPLLGVSDDTMLKHWELFCELEKSLDVQASIYTLQPQWKHQRSALEPSTLYKYCCTDSAVTYEINEVLETQLKPGSRSHYNFNRDLLPLFLYMELQGIRYASDEAKTRLGETYKQIYALQAEVNQEAGIVVPTALQEIKDICCYKRSTCSKWEDLYSCPLKPFSAKIYRIVELASKSERTASELGELSILLKVHLNVDSPDQMCTFLYQKKGYDIQYKKEGGRETSTQTTDAKALLMLFIKHNKDAFPYKLLILRGLLTSLSSLSISPDPDGRVRCGYNIVGAETGRITCYTSPTGSGMNLQTVTHKHRSLYIADDGYELANYDLSGADGWTVACYCAMLGDTTMLDDYLFGLKPARIIALMHMYGIDINDKSRPELKTLSKEVPKEGWLYPSCKQVHHGTSYGMGPDTCSANILERSYKETGIPIFVDVITCTLLRGLVLSRYRGIKDWHNLCQRKLNETGVLTACDGNTRIFMGRRRDHSTIMSYYAHEPQHTTTYAINLVATRLWRDPENRDGNRLIIRPTHQVHDAIMVQWPKERRDWAKTKMREYFNNKLTIAGQTVVIPFEGNYGPAWEKWEGEC